MAGAILLADTHLKSLAGLVEQGPCIDLQIPGRLTGDAGDRASDSGHWCDAVEYRPAAGRLAGASSFLRAGNQPGTAGGNRGSPAAACARLVQHYGAAGGVGDRRCSPVWPGRLDAGYHGTTIRGRRIPGDLLGAGSGSQFAASCVSPTRIVSHFSIWAFGQASRRYDNAFGATGYGRPVNSRGSIAGRGGLAAWPSSGAAGRHRAVIAGLCSRPTRRPLDRWPAADEGDSLCCCRLFHPGISGPHHTHIDSLCRDAFLHTVDRAGVGCRSARRIEHSPHGSELVDRNASRRLARTRGGHALGNRRPDLRYGRGAVSLSAAALEPQSDIFGGGATAGSFYTLF